MIAISTPAPNPGGDYIGSGRCPEARSLLLPPVYRSHLLLVRGSAQRSLRLTFTPAGLCGHEMIGAWLRYPAGGAQLRLTDGLWPDSAQFENLEPKRFDLCQNSIDR
jgi:hypothetical protein